MNSFNEFVKFISEDPVMLGLCGAIILLVLIFIIVLLFGGRKSKSKDYNVSLENTSTLLKNSIDDEPLRSTQEFTMNNVDKTREISSLESLVEEESEKETPISIPEALNLKAEREEQIEKDTIQIPVINNDRPVDIAIPKFEDDATLPIIDNIPQSNTSVNQPFSSVVVNRGDELPKMDELQSNTEIIRHIPILDDTPTVKGVEVNKEESLDDIDLPKLNTKEETSVINSLAGESFKL